MKYSMKSLDTAIDMLLPKIRQAKDNGIDFNRPSLLKMVAEDFFVKSIDREWNPTYEERVAYFVCQDAYRDLKDKGYFEFGSMEII